MCGLFNKLCQANYYWSPKNLWTIRQVFKISLFAVLDENILDQSLDWYLVQMDLCQLLNDTAQIVTTSHRLIISYSSFEFFCFSLLKLKRFLSARGTCHCCPPVLIMQHNVRSICWTAMSVSTNLCQ